MSRRKNGLLVPGAREALDKLRNQVAEQKAQSHRTTAATSTPAVPIYSTTGTTMLNVGTNQGGPAVPEGGTGFHLVPNSAPTSDGNSKASIQSLAQSLGIPYQPGNNAEMKAKDAGKLGGQVGGEMVKRLIAAAEQQMSAGQHPGPMKTK